MSKPDPKFVPGEEVIFEDPQLGDRTVTITSRHWEPITATWTYAHKTQDTGHRTASHQPESNYRSDIQR